jgi:twitching motility protein PilT
MRDSETVKAALDLAETGHLVISTLHTSSSIQTITRLINFFPLEHQNNIRSKIADNLEGILSQRLIPRSDKN